MNWNHSLHILMTYVHHDISPWHIHMIGSNDISHDICWWHITITYFYCHDISQWHMLWYMLMTYADDTAWWHVEMTYTVYSMTYTVYSMTYTAYSMTHTAYSMTCTMYSMTYTMYSMTYQNSVYVINICHIWRWRVLMTRPDDLQRWHMLCIRWHILCIRWHMLRIWWHIQNARTVNYYVHDMWWWPILMTCINDITLITS